MKFDFIPSYPMHRHCTNLKLTLLSLSGWVRKLHVLFKACTRTYWNVPPHTNVEFLYWHVPSCTGMYWDILGRTNLPDPVQVYRIPDAGSKRAGRAPASRPGQPSPGPLASPTRLGPLARSHRSVSPHQLELPGVGTALEIRLPGTAGQGSRSLRGDCESSESRST